MELTHVCSNLSLAGALRIHGCARVRAFCENFAVGPVAQSLPSFAAARSSYWRGAAAVGDYAPGDLTSVARPGPPPVLVWTTSWWRERLTLWWILSAVADLGSVADWSIADPSRTAEGEPEGPLCVLTPEEIDQHIESARPVQASDIHEARMLWAAFAAPTPAAVRDVDWSTVRQFPDARRLFARYADALPRWDAGRSFLSPNDLTLIGWLSREWRPLTGLDLDSPSQETFFDLAVELGNSYVLDRLAAFADGPNNLIASRVISPERTPWTRQQYRLTAHGERVLTEGFEDPGAIPEVSIGGYVAYRPPIWYRIDGPDGWAVTAQPASSA